MTDDNTARYRSNDPFSSRPTGPDGQGSDPLAELARLIGQNDQFAELGREARAAAPRDVPQYSEPAPQPELPYDDRSYDARSYGDRAVPEPRFDAPYAPQPAAEWHHPSGPPSYDPFVPAAHRVPAEEASPAPGDHHQDAPNEPRPFHFEIPPPPAPSHRAPFDAASLEAGLSRHEPSFQPPMPDHSTLPPPADEFYDDAPQGGRRKGLVTVVAVLCLAVLGTGAAFGYRTWFGGPAVKSPPPVIRASAEPSKVAPPPAADPSANKISYDRFGDRGQNEQVVLREEKPVDVRDATRSGPARPMTPGALNPASAAGTPAAASPGANPPSVLTEPKRVRTVPIRPDMPDTAAATRPQAIAQAVPPPRQTAVAGNAPLDLANPAPPPQVRATAPRAAPQAQSVPPASSGNAPLSLNPDAGPPPAAAARAAPTRVASAPAVSAPAASGNGSYLVQVSSQRSEADAQAAYRSIKSKYSSVLGDRQPVIRRADLAGKGTYYRAMVGPFGTRDQAIQLCSSLKAAGGDCVVQAN